MKYEKKKLQLHLRKFLKEKRLISLHFQKKITFINYIINK